MSNIYRCQFTGRIFSDEASRTQSEQDYLKTQVDNVFIDDAMSFKTTINTKSVSNETIIDTAKKIMKDNSVLFERLAVVEKKELEGAMKFDNGKSPVSLIPRSALIGAANVLQMGKKKYSAHNWRKGMDWSRLVDATMRHLMLWNEGVDLDEESKLNHLHHSLVNLMFLCEYQEKGLGNDDRFKEGLNDNNKK
jgi:hypothetical protein